MYMKKYNLLKHLLSASCENMTETQLSHPQVTGWLQNPLKGKKQKQTNKKKTTIRKTTFCLLLPCMFSTRITLLASIHVSCVLKLVNVEHSVGLAWAVDCRLALRQGTLNIS